MLKPPETKGEKPTMEVLTPDSREKVDLTCLFSSASILNHSCQPNLSIQSPVHGYRYNFVATSNIAEGEELFWRYSPEQKHEKLLADLYEQYFFECECPSCKLRAKAKHKKQPKQPKQEAEEPEEELQIQKFLSKK